MCDLPRERNDDRMRRKKAGMDSGLILVYGLNASRKDSCPRGPSLEFTV